MSNTNAPVSGKVWGSLAGGGAGTTIATFLVWLLGVTVWGASSTAESATDTLSAVPFPVSGLVILVVGFGGLFLGGYMAKHVPQPLEAGEVVTLVGSVSNQPEVKATVEDFAVENSYPVEVLHEADSDRPADEPAVAYVTTDPEKA